MRFTQSCLALRFATKVARDARCINPTSNMSFLVRSLNIWHLPANISRDNEPRLAALVDKASGWAKDGSGTSVLALQEVWTEQAQFRLASAVEQEGWHALRGRGGLVLCTRWPQIEQFALTYKNRGVRAGASIPARAPSIRCSRPPRQHAERWDHGDYQAAVVGSQHPWGKGVIAALLDAGSPGRILVATSHLVANYQEPKPQPIDKPDRYAGVRAAQVVELALALQTWRRGLPSGTPVVLCGDLNMDRHERLFECVLAGLGEQRGGAGRGGAGRGVAE